MLKQKLALLIAGTIECQSGTDVIAAVLLEDSFKAVTLRAGHLLEVQGSAPLGDFHLAKLDIVGSVQNLVTGQESHWLSF